MEEKLNAVLRGNEQEKEREGGRNETACARGAFASRSRRVRGTGDGWHSLKNNLSIPL